MTKKHTIIHAGISVDNPHQYNVTIGTDLGQFSGTVLCQPENYEYESKYFGFELAEIKATLKWMSAKQAHWDARLKALTTFWRQMSQTRSYEADAYWVKKMLLEADKAAENREYWKQRRAKLKNIYHEKIMNYDSWTKKQEHRLSCIDG